MKKIVLALVIGTSMMSSAIAQKEVKYDKMYYKDAKIETNDLTISIDNAVSTDGETKFKLKITNKTNDFIIYKPSESKFVINGKDMKISEKEKTIDPNGSETWVINLKGAGYNSVKDYSYVIEGLYKVSTSEKGTPAPDFKLPVSQNDFTAGNFKVTLAKLYKQSDATNLKMDIAYSGDKMGIVFPTKAGVVMPDGKEHAAVVKSGLLGKTGPLLLKKGDKGDMTFNWDRMEGGKAMDMQKVDMTVKWNETFVEVTPEKIKAETIALTFDEATSNAKK